MSTVHVDRIEEGLKLETSLSPTPHEIMNVVPLTHVVSHEHDSFDVEYFLSLTQNIILSSNQFLDKIAQDYPTHPAVQAAAAATAAAGATTAAATAVKPNFKTPICLLQSILKEMPCNTSGERNAHETTLSILKKLSTYPWEIKALVTLAVVASEYGEFLLLSQYQQSDQLANPLAIVKGVPVSQNLKKLKAIPQLNLVITLTSQVIDSICQLVKLSRSSHHNLKDVTEIVKTAMNEIPMDVYWCIKTLVACNTNVCFLKSDEGKTEDLVQYAHKIQITADKLAGYLTSCKRKIKAFDDYGELIHTITICIETVELIKALIYFKDPPQPIFKGSTKRKEDMFDALKKKNVLLFFSNLHVFEYDIAALTYVYNHQLTKKENQYTILWIPVVEKWTDELRKHFETLKHKMPWYTVEKTDAPIAGIKYIKENWNIINRPTVVVMDARTKILNYDALLIIRVWGHSADPFTDARETELITNFMGDRWLHYVLENTDASINQLISEEKYIFVYGGKEKAWIEQFTSKANAFRGDDILKPKIGAIEMFHVERSELGGDDNFRRFFSTVESIFSMVIKVHKEVVEEVTKQVQKLLSYKNERGWVVLIKGSYIVVGMCSGAVIDKVLKNHTEKWKGIAKDSSKKFDFPKLFTDAIAAEEKDYHACTEVELKVDGVVPEIMSCHICPRTMRKYFSYQCCHDDVF